MCSQDWDKYDEDHRRILRSNLHFKNTIATCRGDHVGTSVKVRKILEGSCSPVEKCGQQG